MTGPFLDPDPRALSDDELAELLATIPPARRRRTFGLPIVVFASALFFLLGLLAARSVFAASRGAHDIPAGIAAATAEPDRGLPEAPTGAGASPAPAAQLEEPTPSPSGASTPERLIVVTPAPRPSIEQPGPELVTVTPRPVVVDAPKGYAGWHRDPSVSWFGPGFYGQRTACGQTLTEDLQGVAHKTLPCGTLVTFRNAAGTTVTVPVVDRGPYVAGRQWDLTGATCLALDHCFTGPLDWRLH